LLGWSKYLIAGASAVYVVLWGYVSQIPGPWLAVIGLAVFALVLVVVGALVLIWRASQPVTAGPTGQGFSATAEHALIKGEDDALVVREGPRFIVSYRNVAGNWERLSFLNEGKRTAINTTVSALTHEEQGEHESIRRRHEITMMPRHVPVIIPSGTGEGKIVVEESPGHGTRLIDIIRKGTPESIDSVVVSFEDGERHQFEQPFELTCQTDGSIRWDPGPVRLLRR
jgi:hypothetical protein